MLFRFYLFFVVFCFTQSSFSNQSECLSRIIQRAGLLGILNTYYQGMENWDGLHAKFPGKFFHAAASEKLLTLFDLGGYPNAHPGAIRIVLEAQALSAVYDFASVRDSLADFIVRNTDFYSLVGRHYLHCYKGLIEKRGLPAMDRPIDFNCPAEVELYFRAEPKYRFVRTSTHFLSQLRAAAMERFQADWKSSAQDGRRSNKPVKIARPIMFLEEGVAKNYILPFRKEDHRTAGDSENVQELRDTSP